MFDGGPGRAVATRRGLLARGATGLLAGGGAVAIGDTAGAAPAAATMSATTPDWINVAAAPYNADPTGAGDSTAAFQGAISAAVGAGGGVIYIPAGTYSISSTLTCTSTFAVRCFEVWVTRV